MAEVVDVTVDRQRSVSVVYDDGVTAAFALDELRRACPCAGCRGAREQGREPFSLPAGSPGPTITDAELVGAWGLSVRWSDGHEAGIYSWDAMRRWHDGLPA
ncbi:MAG: DUF971 domain-containing protein [Actinomycetota bacterium]|uniref:Unannotated protein n=1 Tax=freshwater metagenome TaxID=449393 RepID=A0A6J6YJB5_9ZZZZ|nr:DUF971 domain-containing protein [Actinomycetota bacterium]MSX79931.1 DUF971 domain-containing protein [Actinomycetota bacterium]